MIISPSILAADFSKLFKEVKSVYKAGATYIHIDVMDGHFVPNITIGPLVIKQLTKKIPLIYDVHLMILNPIKYAADFVKVGANIITFHYEAVSDVDETIEKIKELGVKVGISIKPNTDVNVLIPYLNNIDLVLIMSVEPGFGGQSFLISSLNKIKFLSEQKKLNNYKYLIEVDGGINEQSAKQVAEVGAEVIVAGTYIYGEKNRKDVIKYLKSL